jgi:hypothetical protein
MLKKTVSRPQMKQYPIFLSVLKLFFCYSVSVEGFEYFYYFKPKNADLVGFWSFYLKHAALLLVFCSLQGSFQI